MGDSSAWMSRDVLSAVLGDMAGSAIAIAPSSGIYRCRTIAIALGEAISLCSLIVTVLGEATHNLPVLQCKKCHWGSETTDRQQINPIQSNMYLVVNIDNVDYDNIHFHDRVELLPDTELGTCRALKVQWSLCGGGWGMVVYALLKQTVNIIMKNLLKR